MDLATIGDLLGDFATFGKNIGPALQNWQDLVVTIVNGLDGGLSSAAEDTGDGIDSFSSVLSSGSSEAE
ncbi:PorH family porin [Corynebacterium suedekumii]|uniref:PorH family porin n=1 Tax=Corynebacterium suedekumii TaxID=3049801 RepID=A0ABY8VR72_9CORY|nr:PorH family porin [Corynebacterium suedekumii]WIM70698.1 PorH family porin [Corynebacterium suedekumii]